MVKIEEISVESDLILFKIKPQLCRQIGLDNLKSIYISSNMEYLNIIDGQFICSIVNWSLETNQIRVNYLKELITNGINANEILREFNRKKKFLKK